MLVVCGWLGYDEIEKTKRIIKMIVEERFQFSGAKLDRDSKGAREEMGMEGCGINIWDRPELKLDWFGKYSLFFENNFRIFLLSRNSDTSIFKVYGVLH